MYWLYLNVPDEGSLLPKNRDCTTSNDFELYIYIYMYMYHVMNIFPCLSKELPYADRITASPSSRYNPTLVKSMFLWISLSMYNPTSSQITAPSLAPIKTSKWLFFMSKRFLCGRIGLFFLHSSLFRTPIRLCFVSPFFKTMN